MTGVHGRRSLRRRAGTPPTAAAVNGFPYDFGSNSRSIALHAYDWRRQHLRRLRHDRPLGLESDDRFDRRCEGRRHAVAGSTFSTQDYHLYSARAAASEWAATRRRPRPRGDGDEHGELRADRLERTGRLTTAFGPSPATSPRSSSTTARCPRSSAKRSIRISRPSTASRSATAIARRTIRRSTGT